MRRLNKTFTNIVKPLLGCDLTKNTHMMPSIKDLFIKYGINYKSSKEEAPHIELEKAIKAVAMSPDQTLKLSFVKHIPEIVRYGGAYTQKMMNVIMNAINEKSFGEASETIVELLTSLSKLPNNVWNVMLQNNVADALDNKSFGQDPVVLHAFIDMIFPKIEENDGVLLSMLIMNVCYICNRDEEIALKLIKMLPDLIRADRTVVLFDLRIFGSGTKIEDAILNILPNLKFDDDEAGYKALLRLCFNQLFSLDLSNITARDFILDFLMTKIDSKNFRSVMMQGILYHSWFIYNSAVTKRFLEEIALRDSFLNNLKILPRILYVCTNFKNENDIIANIENDIIANIVECIINQSHSAEIICNPNSHDAKNMLSAIENINKYSQENNFKIPLEKLNNALREQTSYLANYNSLALNNIVKSVEQNFINTVKPHQDKDNKFFNNQNKEAQEILIAAYCDGEIHREAKTIVKNNIKNIILNCDVIQQNPALVDKIEITDESLNFIYGALNDKNKAPLKKKIIQSILGKLIDSAFQAIYPKLERLDELKTFKEQILNSTTLALTQNNNTNIKNACEQFIKNNHYDLLGINNDNTICEKMAIYAMQWGKIVEDKKQECVQLFHKAALSLQTQISKTQPKSYTGFISLTMLFYSMADLKAIDGNINAIKQDYPNLERQISNLSDKIKTIEEKIKIDQKLSLIDESMEKTEDSLCYMVLTDKTTTENILMKIADLSLFNLANMIGKQIDKFSIYEVVKNNDNTQYVINPMSASRFKQLEMPFHLHDLLKDQFTLSADIGTAISDQILKFIAPDESFVFLKPQVEQAIQLVAFNPKTSVELSIASRQAIMKMTKTEEVMAEMSATLKTFFDTIEKPMLQAQQSKYNIMNAKLSQSIAIIMKHIQDSEFSKEINIMIDHLSKILETIIDKQPALVGKYDKDILQYMIGLLCVQLSSKNVLGYEEGGANQANPFFRLVGAYSLAKFVHANGVAYSKLTTAQQQLIIKEIGQLLWDGSGQCSAIVATGLGNITPLYEETMKILDSKLV